MRSDELSFLASRYLCTPQERWADIERDKRPIYRQRMVNRGDDFLSIVVLTMGGVSAQGPDVLRHCLNKCIN
jgi:hypothetical protein